MVCAEQNIGSDVVLDAPDGTPSCVGYVESDFSPFGDSVSVGAGYVHGLCQAYQRLRNHFRRTRWNSSVTCVMWNLVLNRLEIALTSLQDRCSVCAKRTIGSEIILDAPDGAPR
jgi:hypothetical protein